MEEMKDRIKRIMESQQMSQQEFAASLGIPPSTLSSIFTGRTKPTNNHTQAIHRAFPSVNISWLLFGEGKMLSDSSESSSSSPASAAAAPGFSSSGEAAERSLFDLSTDAEASPTPYSAQRNPYIPIAKKNDIKMRSIKEIRVFYDDGTYESFVPGK